MSKIKATLRPDSVSATLRKGNVIITGEVAYPPVFGVHAFGSFGFSSWIDGAGIGGVVRPMDGALRGSKIKGVLR